MSYKIIYNKNECIGAGACEMFSPNFWKVNNKGKAELKESVEKETGIFELTIND